VLFRSLLNKDIRFIFAPNSATLDQAYKENLKNLDAIRQLLQVSPGSTILLRGHVDNGLVQEFKRQGGDAFVRQMALKAMELSKNRSGEIKRLLIERHKIDGARLETVGRGWEEPLGTDNEKNRRVEAQWFTVE
jgi:NitT/TauT family transport system substrate-binding protein